MKGYLKVMTMTANGSLPIAGAGIYIKTKSGETLYSDISNENGESEIFELEAPDVELTLDENYKLPAYSTYDVEVTAANYKTVMVFNVEIVATTTSYLKVELHPEEEDNQSNNIASENFFQDVLRTDVEVFAPEKQIETYNIPPVGLLLPMDQRNPVTAPYQSIRQVYIPDKITVHLGAPNNAAARNVTVPFIEYIANVASSEIYPTWPYNSLVANIHCIVTFAINRVYTEWYRGRGFNFDITNSTQYDQYFVEGRNIFQNIYEIASNVFNVYVRRFAFRNPFFTQFCNGTTTTCAGLSQWGTVTLANQGMTPIEILRYFFPDDIELVGTDNIRGIHATFPGFALSSGFNNAFVQKMQVYLNRIRINYPLIPLIPNPNGFFDAATEAAVRTFQRTFNLTSDGIIGKATWNAISFIYVGIVKLAELNSEGERVNIGRNPPNVVLRQGSMGANVLELQFILNYISAYYSSIPAVIQDSRFGASVDNAVRQFQKTFSLRQDGIVGPTTWNKLYSVFKSIRDSSIIPPNPAPPSTNNPIYPQNPLRVGSRGDDVKLMQTYLNTIRTVYQSINPLLVADGIFGTNTRNAVIAFQQQFLLSPDGIIGPITWNKIVEMFNQVTGGVV